MKKNKVKKGDVFKIQLNEEYVGYFQYLLLDPCQLNSEVIRVFSHRSSVGESMNIDAIVLSKVEFFAHVVIKFGLNLGIWEKIGNRSLEEDFEVPLFRDVYGQKHLMDGNQIVYQDSNSWNVWRAGDQFDDRKMIGTLKEEYKLIDIGLVYPPTEIVHRMQTGEYSNPYYT